MVGTQRECFIEYVCFIEYGENFSSHKWSSLKKKIVPLLHKISQLDDLYHLSGQRKMMILCN